MIRWCTGWIVKIGLTMILYVGILYVCAMISMQWAELETISVLEKYAQGNIAALIKSIQSFFPYLTELVNDIIRPFINLTRGVSIATPISIVYEVVNVFITAMFFKVFEFVYQGLIEPLSDRLLGKVNRLADIWVGLVAAYLSLVATDIANIHIVRVLEGVYKTFSAAIGSIAVVGTVVGVLLLIVLVLWGIGKVNMSLMSVLGKWFLDILLGMVIVALVYLTAGCVLAMQMGGMMQGIACIIMVFSILGITIISAILFKNSVLKV